MDPWIGGNPKYPAGHEFSRVDAILITHGHFDHIHDAVPLAKKFSPQVVAIYETCHWLEAKQEHLSHEQGRLAESRAIYRYHDARHPQLRDPAARLNFPVVSFSGFGSVC
jgi:phosphoribosyl 1,2-cyclic phosphodiesterase